MPTFIVTSRKTSPLITTEVDAETREQAVTKIITDVEEGEEVHIFSVEEAVPEAASQAASAQAQPEPAAESAS